MINIFALCEDLYGNVYVCICIDFFVNVYNLCDFYLCIFEYGFNGP